MSEQFKKTLKSLENCAETAKLAFGGASDIYDKVRMRKLEKALRECRTQLKKYIYDFEDAETFITK